MYLQYIDKAKIGKFIKSLDKKINAYHIVSHNNFAEVFTDCLEGPFHISDFECINTETGAVHSQQWRKFMIEELDKCNLGDEYIDILHDYLEQDTIYGAII